jgi:hypothetical protein
LTKYESTKGYGDPDRHRCRVGTGSVDQAGYYRIGGRAGDRVAGGVADLEQKEITQSNMEREQVSDEKVPLFKKWSYWYMLVAGFLLVCIGFFYFLTKHFS